MRERERQISTTPNNQKPPNNGLPLIPVLSVDNIHGKKVVYIGNGEDTVEKSLSRVTCYTNAQFANLANIYNTLTHILPSYSNINSVDC